MLVRDILSRIKSLWALGLDNKSIKLALEDYQKILGFALIDFINLILEERGYAS